MTDRELLELAAKAVGIKLIFPGEGIGGRDPRNAETIDVWNPLSDDGEALRLSSQLQINIRHGSQWVEAIFGESHVSVGVIAEYFKNNDSRCEAMRRVIVRAAADIGGSADNG